MWQIVEQGKTIFLIRVQYHDFNYPITLLVSTTNWWRRFSNDLSITPIISHDIYRIGYRSIALKLVEQGIGTYRNQIEMELQVPEGERWSTIFPAAGEEDLIGTVVSHTRAGARGTRDISDLRSEMIETGTVPRRFEDQFIIEYQ
jgi:hypothetical protein